MHGVQPIAKIAPSPNDASQPPRVPTMRPPSRSPSPDRCPGAAKAIVPVALATDAGGAGLERPPRAVEGGDAQHPGEIQSEHDEQDRRRWPEDGR